MAKVENNESTQRAELHRKIWSIADNVRGAVDGWDFKQYILGILFYRFISENITEFFNSAEHEAGDIDFDYAEISDKEAEEYFRPNTVEDKGFFILPSQLFKNIVKKAKDNENLNTDLANIFKAIEGSAVGFASEDDIKGLFEEIDTTSNRLGGTVAEKNKRLTDILTGIGEINFKNFQNNEIDAFGDAYEYLISNYASNAGKSGGEFFTPQTVSKLLARLVMEGKTSINKVYDPTCGTGGMLTTAYSHIKGLNETADIRLFGQEFMGQSYAVGLAEMLIKDQDATNFRHADTLKEDCFRDTKMRFLLENPPFGTPWKGADAKAGQEAAVMEEYAKGERSRWPAGLPGGGDSQLLFMQSAVNKMEDKLGRAAIITNGSPLFNGGTASGESQIRRWLLENDLIEAIIAMPTDLFYNTGIASYIWILSKNKREERKGKIQLIDATEIYHPLRKSLGNKRR